MKKLLLLMPLLVLFSCSVQKRKYQKGYHVNWNKGVKSTKERKDPIAKNKLIKKEAPQTEIVLPTADEPQLVVSSNNNTVPFEIKQKKRNLVGDEPCDDLIFKDGSEIKGKVVEITTTEIKYKKCEMLEGPVYVAKKSDVFMIKYSNGTREVFKEQTTTLNQTPYKSAYKGPKKVHPFAILSLVFGILGIYPLIVFSILAIVFGNMAQKRIAAQPDVYKGEGAAVAGKVLGIVMLSLMALALLLFVVLLVLLA